MYHKNALNLPFFSQQPPELLGIESMINLTSFRFPINLKIDQQESLDFILICLLICLYKLNSEENFDIALDREILNLGVNHSPIVLFNGELSLCKTFNCLKQLISQAQDKITQTDEYLQSPVTIILSNNKSNLSIKTLFCFVINSIDQQCEIFCQQNLSAQQYAMFIIENFPAQCLRVAYFLFQNRNNAINNICLLSDKELQERNLGHKSKTLRMDNDLTIGQRLEAISISLSEQIAIIDKEETITYGEFNARVNQVAHYLISLGVQESDVIGVALDRSIEATIFLYGIVKICATYLPLDTSYPENRLKIYIEDTHVKLIFSKRSLVKTDTLYDIANFIFLDDDIERLINGMSKENPLVQGSIDSDFYITFTSGSTGRPKGVRRTQRAAINNFLWAWKSWDNIDIRQEVCCQVSSYNFPPSVGQIFTPILRGIKLLIIDDETLKNTAKLFHALSLEQVTRFWGVPSVIESLIEYLADNNLTLNTIKTIAVFGEKISRGLINRIRKVLPHVSLSHSYGLAETLTICSGIIKPEEQYIHVGLPVSNVQLYVLDKNMKHQAIGVVGEIFVSSPSVIDSYINNELETLARCLPNPFNAKQSTLFRTGDFGRLLPGGYLELVGRQDSQVKILGHRIELSEIDSILQAHTQIRGLVTKLIEQGEIKKIVVFFTTFKYLEITQINIIIAELKVMAAQHFSAHMQPHEYIYQEKFLYLPNGKIDKRHLHIEINKDATLVLPNNEIEKCILLLWQECFGFKNIGVECKFFALGGTSLLAIKLSNKIKKHFNFDCTIQHVFKLDTVRLLSQAILHRDVSENQQVMIKHSNQTENIPLTYAQRPFWILNEIYPYNTMHHIGFNYIVEGDISVNHLKEAFAILLRRHSALRICLQKNQGTVYQKILANPELPFIYLSENDHKLKSNEFDTFRLYESVLWRAVLIQREPRVFSLNVMMHHIIADAISINIFKQELSLIYSKLISSQPIYLDPIDYQYHDFVLWQEKYLQSDLSLKNIQYWRDYLRGACHCLNFPMSAKRKQIRDFDAEEISYTLDPQLIKLVRELCLKSQKTLFNAFVSVFATTLYRYSGQDNFIIGVPISARDLEGMEQLIGSLSETLLLRFDFTDELNFRDLLSKLHEDFSNNYIHYLPFECILEKLEVAKPNNYNPLFQIFFSFQEQGNDSFSLTDTQVTVPAQSVEVKQVEFDMLVSIITKNDQVSVKVRYASSLFSREQILAILNSYQILIKQLIQHDTMPLRHISLLTTDEFDALVSQNSELTFLGHQPSLLQLFTNQCHINPKQIAINSNTIQYTYEELDQLTDNIAHDLQKHGVMSGNYVGICLERSAMLIACLIAVLKCHAAYLPLDPHYPADRLQEMMIDADIKLLITSKQIDTFDGVGHIQRYYIEDAIFQDDGAKILLTALHQESQDLAYIIYTSGSTGKPKGVVVCQASVVNLLQDIRARIFGNDRPIDVIGITTVGFDIAALEIWLPLISGGQYIVVEHEEALDPRLLANKIKCAKPTLVQATPTTWQYLASELMISNVKIPFVFSGGEVLSSKLSSELLVVGDKVWNMYGPTETTIWATYEAVHSTEIFPSSIGRPFRNVEVYVLDSDLNPVPRGIVGELCIGGACLAVGYHNQQSMNQECFIRWSFGNSQFGYINRRIYKTGDLVYVDFLGKLRYISRNDYQIKIDGRRVELSEIEYYICLYPAVITAIVNLITQNNTKILVAYVKINDKKLNISDLRTFLREKLPIYMIPSEFIFLDIFPKTKNDKIDRKALPIPEFSNYSTVAEIQTIPIMNAYEHQVYLVWKKLLNFDVLALDQNFFDIGGSSVKAIAMVNELRECIGVQLNVIEVFEFTTIRTLAALLASRIEATNTEKLLNSTSDKNSIAAARREAFVLRKKRIVDNSTIHKKNSSVLEL